MTKEDIVLFVAGDPGGAAALAPVIKGWQGRKTVLAYRQAVMSLRREGIELLELDEDRAETSAAVGWIDKCAATVVCCATSVNGLDWEKHFFLAARERQVPSISLLDYWSNYVPRYSLTQRLDAMPDAFAIMDERARAEMLEQGFPGERLIITGHPVLDEARVWAAGVSVADRARFRELLGLEPNERASLFISQPLREMRAATGEGASIPEDEYLALQRLTDSLAASGGDRNVLLVKLHPREPNDKFDSLIATLPVLVRVVDPQVHRWEVCMGADCIFGISSMLLEEARVMSRPVCYIRCSEELDRSTPLRSLQKTSSKNFLPARDRVLQLIQQKVSAPLTVPFQ